MTENEYCGFLFTRISWAYPVLARLAPLLMLFGILKPTDEQPITDSRVRANKCQDELQARSDYSSKVSFIGIPMVLDWRPLKFYSLFYALLIILFIALVILVLTRY